jgi:hypothetical protein
VAALVITPLAWSVAALVLLLPRSQDALIALFVPNTDLESAGELQACLRHLFAIVAGLVLLDGIQTILSGVIQVRRRHTHTHAYGTTQQLRAWHHDGSLLHEPFGPVHEQPRTTIHVPCPCVCARNAREW